MKAPILLGRGALHLLDLHAVVEGEDAHLGPVAGAVGGPVHLFELGVLAQGGVADAAVEEELELGPGRIGGRAAVAADGEGAAGVGVVERGRPVLGPSPSSQPLSRPDMKPSPAPRTLKTSIGKPGPVSPSSRLSGMAPVKATAPSGPALADERGVGDLAHGAQCGDGVGGAAGDVELLLRADDQVEEVQGRLQLGRHLLRTR